MEWLATILRRFETTDEVGSFKNCKFEIVRVAGITIQSAPANVDYGKSPRTSVASATRPTARTYAPVRICVRCLRIDSYTS
jgi:hypothetical protein